MLFDFIGNFFSLKGDFCYFILKNIIKYKVCIVGWIILDRIIERYKIILFLFDLLEINILFINIYIILFIFYLLMLLYIIYFENKDKYIFIFFFIYYINFYIYV